MEVYFLCAKVIAENCWLYLSFRDLIARNRQYSYERWTRKVSLAHQIKPQVYTQKLTKLSTFQTQMKGVGALWGSWLEFVFHFEGYFLASSDSSVGQKSHIFPILSYLALGTDFSQNLHHWLDLKCYYYGLNLISYMRRYKAILKTWAVSQSACSSWSSS